MKAQGARHALCSKRGCWQEVMHTAAHAWPVAWPALMRVQNMVCSNRVCVHPRAESPTSHHQKVENARLDANTTQGVMVVECEEDKKRVHTSPPLQFIANTKMPLPASCSTAGHRVVRRPWTWPPAVHGSACSGQALSPAAVPHILLVASAPRHHTTTVSICFQTHARIHRCVAPTTAALIASCCPLKGHRQ